MNLKRNELLNKCFSKKTICFFFDKSKNICTANKLDNSPLGHQID